MHYRKRIGEDRIKRIFEVSVHLHRDKIAAEDALMVTTTVQEANVTEIDRDEAA